MIWKITSGKVAWSEQLSEGQRLILRLCGRWERSAKKCRSHEKTYLYTVFDKSVHSWQFSEGQRLILRPFLVKIWVWSFTLNWSDVANENHFTQGIIIKISITSSENFPDGTGYWKGDKPLTVRFLFKNRRQPFGRLFCWLSWALLCYIGPHFYFSFFEQNIFETWSLLRAGRSNIKKLLVGRCLLLCYTSR